MSWQFCVELVTIVVAGWNVWRIVVPQLVKYRLVENQFDQAAVCHHLKM
jgi:hypothetical protein